MLVFEIDARADGVRAGFAFRWMAGRDWSRRYSATLSWFRLGRGAVQLGEESAQTVFCRGRGHLQGRRRDDVNY